MKLADALLLQFCKRTQRQYGDETISTSMHMICHLKECILDYGPLHEFWLFPFERFNGILGQLPHNNKLIEVQLFRRFLKDQYAKAIPHPTMFQEDFSEFLNDSATLVGSVANTFSPFVLWPPAVDTDGGNACNYTINTLKKQ